MKEKMRINISINENSFFSVECKLARFNEGNQPYDYLNENHFKQLSG